ncbi:DUF2145 domain-containing protein [Chitinimonas sp. BJYL2]|uniref:DUF2145 domain-containing protein n=1 Tax=Chitinimonas sp. BJYL2 TaxID=2976696 RepID=UPI0022B49E04|nr:DUF2145 domain-containing protein [Chitinimonas sp. BJYL2]
MKRSLALSGLLLTLALPAQAGKGCDERPVGPDELAQALNLALMVRNQLDRSTEQVVIIARIGRDMSQYGLRYSHAGFAWRDHPKGRWFLVHELNECNGDRSSLYHEGLGNLFIDIHAPEALVLTLPTSLQARLLPWLQQPHTLHQAHYNVVAYPFSTRYQNSNQWLLESLAAAMAPEGTVRDRASAQRWLQGAGYRPSTLRLNTFKRLGGRLFSENVEFNDHPPARRFAGKIDVVTVESIEAFLRQQRQLVGRQVMALPSTPKNQ